MLDRQVAKQDSGPSACLHRRPQGTVVWGVDWAEVQKGGVSPSFRISGTSWAEGSGTPDLSASDS